jgi:Spy/CpxP family protein refolding chaperone
MKKLSLIAALALGGLMACSTVAMAQDTNATPKKGGKQRMTVEQRLDMLSTRLSLTDEQKPKVKAVLEDTQKKMQDVPRDERQEKMPAIMEEQTKKMKEILTPDQMEKYTTMQAEMKKKGGKKKADQ